MKQFNTPADSFNNLGAEGAAALISAATDIALVIDPKGIIRDLSIGDSSLEPHEFEAWLNRPWLETVTVESRPKVEALLRDGDSGSASIWRHINHPSSRGTDLPILYATVPIGSDGSILAIGRNAATIAELQQRLLQAQQSMERNYLQSRQIQTRYRLLFQVSSEAVFIIDAASLKVLEANPAADHLLGAEDAKAVGQKFGNLFKDNDGAIESLLREVRTSGRQIQMKMQLEGQPEACLVSASMFSQDESLLFLIRVTQARSITTEEAAAANMRARLFKLMESAPDGYVVTGSDGRILAANRAFLELTQTASEDRVRGESLDRWFGRSGVDLNVLTANLREHGSVRLFATTLRGEYGTNVDVEVSATKVVMNGDETCFGFMIRDIGVRMVESPVRKQSRLSRPVEQLTELIGRLPLRELVKESTNMLERYCIEAALELTGDNRTSTAEILGLSRQSLYVKLRRYGLANSDTEVSE